MSLYFKAFAVTSSGTMHGKYCWAQRVIRCLNGTLAASFDSRTSFRENTLEMMNPHAKLMI